MKVKTDTGSATDARPDTAGVIIAHLCNHVGAWGKGFVLAVNDLSMGPKIAYKAYAQVCNQQCPLGVTQMIECQPDLWVANMIAQNGLDKSAVANGVLVDYNALQECLKTVFRRAVVLKCNVHIPAGMGSGLAGGDKTLIIDMIKSIATAQWVMKLEQEMDFVPEVTLWEFTDTSAKSYVGGAVVPASTDPVTADVDEALNNFTSTGIDLSEDDV
jgi:hypothetical protein